MRHSIIHSILSLLEASDALHVELIVQKLPCNLYMLSLIRHNDDIVQQYSVEIVVVLVHLTKKGFESGISFDDSASKVEASHVKSVVLVLLTNYLSVRHSFDTDVNCFDYFL